MTVLLYKSFTAFPSKLGLLELETLWGKTQRKDPFISINKPSHSLCLAGFDLFLQWGLQRSPLVRLRTNMGLMIHDPFAFWSLELGSLEYFAHWAWKYVLYLASHLFKRWWFRLEEIFMCSLFFASVLECIAINWKGFAVKWIVIESTLSAIVHFFCGRFYQMTFAAPLQSTSYQSIKLSICK